MVQTGVSDAGARLDVVVSIQDRCKIRPRPGEIPRGDSKVAITGLQRPDAGRAAYGDPNQESPGLTGEVYILQGAHRPFRMPNDTKSTIKLDGGGEICCVK